MINPSIQISFNIPSKKLKHLREVVRNNNGYFPINEGFYESWIEKIDSLSVRVDFFMGSDNDSCYNFERMLNIIRQPFF